RTCRHRGYSRRGQLRGTPTLLTRASVPVDCGGALSAVEQFDLAVLDEIGVPAAVVPPDGVPVPGDLDDLAGGAGPGRPGRPVHHLDRPHPLAFLVRRHGLTLWPQAQLAQTPAHRAGVEGDVVPVSPSASCRRRES